MSTPVKSPRRVLSVFSLVMMNFIVVASLRTLPIAAQYGSSLMFYFILATLLFLLPVALCAAELATAWPSTGGIYVWIREAFGRNLGLYSAWMLWICSVISFPMMLSFIAGTIFYLIDPALAENNTAMLLLTLAIFWCCTIANFFGLKISSFISNFAAIIGSIIPMLTILVLATIWILQGNVLHIDFHWPAWVPHINSIQTLVFFSGIIFGLVGIEMSAVHAEEVQDPERNYPRALLYSVLLIIVLVSLSSLSIAVVLPQEKISIVTGLVQAFDAFFSAFHLQIFIPILAGCIILGGLGGLSAWILGPTKALMVALRDAGLPTWMSQVNKHHVPTTLLVLQGIVFTILSGVFLLMPNVSSSYWIISAMATQTALLVYVPMFASVIKLHYSRPEAPRAFHIPFGRKGLWTVCLIGIGMVVAAALLCFIPPDQIDVGKAENFEWLMILCDVVFCVLPVVIYRYFRKVLDARVAVFEPAQAGEK